MVRYEKGGKRPKKVVNKTIKSEKEKADKKLSSAKKSTSGGFYYSFLTIILILCLVQITISAVLNVSKVVAYKSKIAQITKIRDSALTLNEQLKENINNFSNISGLEAIARNNLKMASEDEVLVIISPTKEEEKDEKPRKMGFIKHD